MSGNNRTYFKKYFFDPLFSTRGLGVVIFLGLLLVCQVGMGQVNPTINWSTAYDLDRINVKFSDLFNITPKTNRIILAVDTNPKGEIFVLTFGNGIKKVDSNGNLIDFISGSYFSSPLDFAINSAGKFYVPDNASNNRRINVFSADGTYLAAETIGDGTYGTGRNKFKGPISVAFDPQDNLYVADYYTGSNDSATDRSHVKIYYKNGDFKEFNSVNGNPINSPYRIAADGGGNIYLADLGNGNGQLQEISLDNNGNANLVRQISSAELGSPGDIEIDKEGFIYVADFGNEINITTILNAGNNPSALIDDFDKIKNGISSNKFNVDIFNSNGTYLKSVEDKIDLPLDLAFDNCGKFYINNFELTGKKGTALIGYVDMNFNMDFDLEIYQRSPSLDKEKPVKSNCPGDKTVSLNNGKFILKDYRSEAEFSDNCDDNLELIQTPAPGSEQTSTTVVTITAKDDAGNISDECTFNVVVEEEVPPVNCKPTSLYLDSSGNVNLDTKTIFDGNPNDPAIDHFKVDKEDFSCGELGENDVKLTVFFKNGTSDFCTTRVTIKDTIAPQFTACNIQDIHVELNEGETYTIPHFTTQLNASDNCDSSPEISQNITVGSKITESTTVILTAKDASGNVSNNCSVQIIITHKANPSFTCPDPNQKTVLELDENCEFKVPDYSEKITNFQNFENEPFFAQNSTRNGNLLNVTIHVFDGESGPEVGKCTFPVTLEDNIAPSIVCPDNILIPYTTTKEYTVKDYFSQLEISDNCSQIFTHNQNPKPGTIITSDTEVNFSVTDENNNTNDCSFKIEFYKETELQILNCPEDQSIEFDSNCSYIIPDIASTINTTIEEASVTQNIPAGTRTYESESLTITATYEDQKDTCTIKLIPTDTTPPTIQCPPNQNANYEPAVGFTLPDYTSLAIVSDNCEVQKIEQIPQPGSVIQNDTKITLTATDTAGNTSSCSFKVNLTENEVLQISCPGDAIVLSDENCESKVPDFEENVEINSNSAIYSQNPAAGTIINEDTSIIVSATENGQTVSCSFMLFLKDNIKPVIECPATMDINYTDSWELPDYSQILEITDNCTDFADLTFNQTPAPGTIYTEDGSFTLSLSVTDEGENTTTCTFTVNLNSETGANTAPVAKNDNYEVQENTSLNINASDGVLSNDIDDNVLEAVLKTDVNQGSLQLNPDGSFTYTPNAGFLGTDSFTYVANDGFLDSNEASVSITVVSQNPSEPDFSCKDNVMVELDKNGNATIQPSNLYNGTGEGYTFTLSKSDFSCMDIGDNLVRLSFNGTNTRGYCDVNVIVKDNLPPQIITQDITIALDENGQAAITAQMLDNGTFDNCSNFQLSIDKTNFSCKDLGDNLVTLTAIDDYGNTATASAIVTVTGDCTSNPETDEYIYIYPNPTEGAFQFYVPSNMSISRVEVYDMRARNISAKDFPEGTQNYSMDITGLEEAVYILKLFTNEGKKIIRLVKK